jgi:hypothetical protein
LDRIGPVILANSRGKVGHIIISNRAAIEIVLGRVT